MLTPTHQLQQTKISPPESLSSSSCYSSHSREKSCLGLVLSTCLEHFWSGVVFNGLSLGFYFQLKGLNATACSNCGKQCVLGRPFPVSTLHKVKSIKKLVSTFGAGARTQPAQSPDLNPIQHLWLEQECLRDTTCHQRCYECS